RPPVADADLVQQEVRRECAQHVLGAMREVDDVEKAEDHGQPERKQRIERPVDQANQQLAEQRLGRDAEDLHRASAAALRSYFVMLQPPSRSGRKAWSAGMVARIL